MQIALEEMSLRQDSFRSRQEEAILQYLLALCAPGYLKDVNSGLYSDLIRQNDDQDGYRGDTSLINR